MQSSSNRIRPLFCYSIQKNTFYNLVNILDIYRFLIVISTVVIAWGRDKKLNGILLMSSSFITIVCLISYILFFIRKSYKLCIHKFYSITRMFYTLPDTVLTSYLYFEAFESNFDINPDHGQLYSFSFLTFFLFLSAFNFYWNVLFIKMSFEKDAVEGNQNVLKQDLNNNSIDIKHNIKPTAKKANEFKA